MVTFIFSGGVFTAFAYFLFSFFAPSDNSLIVAILPGVAAGFLVALGIGEKYTKRETIQKEGIIEECEIVNRHGRVHVAYKEKEALEDFSSFFYPRKVQQLPSDEPSKVVLEISVPLTKSWLYITGGKRYSYQLLLNPADYDDYLNQKQDFAWNPEPEELAA